MGVLCDVRVVIRDHIFERLLLRLLNCLFCGRSAVVTKSISDESQEHYLINFPCVPFEEVFTSPLMVIVTSTKTK